MAMTIKQFKATVDQVLNVRALAAQASAYDRSTCISAVSAARHALSGLNEDAIGAIDLKLKMVEALQQLQQTYSDPDGEYTTGRGVIGDILQDILSINPDG